MTEKNYYHNIFEEATEEQIYYMNSDLLDIRDRVLAKCKLKKEEIGMNDDDWYRGKSPIRALFEEMLGKIYRNYYYLYEYLDLYFIEAIVEKYNVDIIKLIEKKEYLDNNNANALWTFDECYQIGIGECSQEKSYQLSSLEYLHYMLELVEEEEREEKDMRTVNFEGNKYDYEVIESYMNDEIRERLHSELAPCSDQEFFEKYIEEDAEFMEQYAMDLFPVDE